MEDNVGVVPAPPGETTDFDYSSPWKFKTNMTLIGVGLCLSTLFLSMRVYTRACLLRKFGWDDVSIAAAWFFSLLTQITCIFGYTNAGIGIHLWNLTSDMFNIYQKVILVAAVVYVPALAFAKVGLIILYHRIMNKRQIYKWALYIIAAVVCGYSIAIIFALVFACNPIQRTWDASITRGSCIDRNGLYIATAVTNIITDLALIVVPIPLVSGLHMPRMQKVGLIIMFTIGCATLITSILRLVTLIPSLTTADPTYQIAQPQIWINVEANLIVICPCLPFLRQFMRRHAPAWITQVSSTAQSYFKDYSSGTVSRSRRKNGLTRLQDDINLAENPGSSHSEARIVKEVEWRITEEPRYESHYGTTTTSHHAQDISHAI